MPATNPCARRRFLQLAVVPVGASLAGCADGDGPSTPSRTGTDPSAATDPPPTDEGTPRDGTASGGDLDLREANVVGVEFEPRNGSYRFSVTLHHDDDGEAGYANWWQVERLDETRLGRRKLLHAHSQQPFTRSETVEIPGNVTCVVVRGHDQTHGYGGQAMLVDLESGTTTAVRQGSEREEFGPDDCP